MQTDVLIVGGGFAGVTVAQELVKKGVTTLLLDKKDYFEVTFANLRNIAAPDATRLQSRKHYRDFLSGRFMQAEVAQLSAKQARLADGQVIHFKHAVIASGSRYPAMAVAKTHSALDIASRTAEMQQSFQQLQQAKKVLVIGGGVVGVELAGEIAHAFPSIELTLAHGGSQILDGFKTKAQQKARQQLENLGVNLQLNRRYQQQGDGYLDSATGEKVDADLVFAATGAQPNNEYLRAELADILNERGLVKVNAQLQVEGYNNLYALGDIADSGEAKLGYLAVEQGKHLAKVIHNTLKNKSSKAYKRHPLMALIPVGQNQGVVQLPFAVTTANLLVNMKQKDLFINKIYKGFGTKPDIAR